MNSIEKAHSWATTAYAVTGVFRSLFAYDALQRVAILGGVHMHQRAVSGMARSVNRALGRATVRFSVRGLEHIDWKQNYIVVSNHQSMFDISLLSEYLAPLEPRYVSKLSLATGVPGISYNLSRGGSALIDRKNPEQALSEITRLGRNVREKHWTAVIFPEGTRSKDGKMKPFRLPGLRTLLREAGDVPVLPITTSGGSQLCRYDIKPMVRNVTLAVTAHAPVKAPDPEDTAALSEFVRSLEETIGSALPEDDRAGRWATK